MQRDVAIGLMRRAITIAETQWPEMADATMEVPLDYFIGTGSRGEGTSAVRDVTAGAVRRDRDREPSRLPRPQRGRAVGAAHPRRGWRGPRLPQLLPSSRRRARTRIAGTSAGSRARTTRGSTTPKGHLVGMPLRDRHDELDMSQYGLVELPSEERHGFIWVVLRRDHPIDVAAHLGELDTEIGALGCDTMTVLLLDRRSAARSELEVGRRGAARGPPRPVRARRHLQPQSAGGERRPRVLRRHRPTRSVGPPDVRQGRGRAVSRTSRRTSGIPRRASAASG